MHLLNDISVDFGQPLGAISSSRKKEFSIDRPRENGRGFMAAYFPINDPLIPTSYLSAYESAEVDVIELGIKAHDPYADGEIIGSSMQRSVGLGTLTEAQSAINHIRQFEYDTLGMIFAYPELKLAPDPEVWSQVDGLLCPRCGGSIALALSREAHKRGVRISKFLPFNMPAPAVKEAATADGFVMLQYTQGKTGLRSARDNTLPSRLATLRAAGITRPILTGIGISTPDQVRHAMDNGADGIVVGSMVIQKAVQGHTVLEDYLCGLREVLRGG